MHRYNVAQMIQSNVKPLYIFSFGQCSNQYPRTQPLLLAQLVDSSVQLSIAQLKDTTCVLELAKVSPQLKLRPPDGLSVKPANSVLLLI